MDTASPAPPLPGHVARYLKELVIDADELLDAARGRLRARYGHEQPRHIAAYRGYLARGRVRLHGRVLADAPRAGPKEDDSWWDNLLETYRRFESDEVPGVTLECRFRAASTRVSSDAEGYYRAELPVDEHAPARLWEQAAVTLADGSLLTAQPVLHCLPDARLGIISDIDDTVLHSSVTEWKTAAQLAFLHNARTRKPLLGVAALYRALQAGPGGQPLHPLFYVSSSPWNLYDLLEDFMELNGIPPGPLLLRDYGFDPGKFGATAGHGHKLERVRELIQELPSLRWVLLGDSGQADAELYAEAAREFGDTIAAIYIRDVDPDRDSAFDGGVDDHIARLAPSGVPMLRVADSGQIARHATSLGLLDARAVAGIEREVDRDRHRPTLAAAARAGAQAGASA